MRTRSVGVLATAAAALFLIPASGATAASLPAHTVIPGACALGATAGESHCDLKLLANLKKIPLASAQPAAGYGPSDIEGAYKLPSGSAGSGQTVAIVDAYDDKTAEADLAAYRSTYGLPACTTANGCFKKVNTAARLGATEISNSYGGAESSSDPSSNSHFNHPGVAITVSSGDSGYGVEYPAASPYVTAVGGTTLSHASTARGWTESAWSGSGSGCSAYETKQSWQTDSGCAHRTVADVSAVADPNTGVNVYDSNCNVIGQLLGQCFKGWGVVGGTSASSPIIASVYALAGNAASVSYGSYPYGHASGLFDVTTGSNGSCGGSYLCTAGAGYDGPTGLGTPNGVSGF